MKRLKQYPVLAALLVLALLAGGSGVVQAQQTDPAPSDSTACPMMQSMMDEGGRMDMEGMDKQAMMERCPMMKRMMEDGAEGEGMSGMMGMMSMMKDCPMMNSRMQGIMRSDSTMEGMMQGMDGRSGAPTQAVVADGVQTAEVTVGSGGFDPKVIRLQAGVPARLAFTRTTDPTCATEVQIPAFGIDKTALPLNEEVVIAFTPEEAGTFSFSCGMDMMRGTLVVTD